MGVRLMGHPAVLAAATWAEWLLDPASWWVIIQVALGLGFVIFVHELGHFLVAKACGVKCEKFFLGFDVGGLKLLSFTWGETEYGIGALPLGGYVKMLGQDDNPSAAAAEAQRARLSGDLPPEPTAAPHPAWDPRSYPAQSVPKRMAIISAGVIMNVIFAVLMAAWAYGRGVREVTCDVAAARTGSAAWRAGLRTGDVITAIGDRTDPIFNDLRQGVTMGDVTKGVEFTVRRPATGADRRILIRPDVDLGAPMIGIIGAFSTRLPDDVSAGLPGAAARAEPPLAGGDTIRAVDGEPVATYAEVLAALARAPGDAVTLTVERTAAGRGAAEPTSVEVRLPAQPVRDVGIVFRAGPIAAVQEDSPAAAAGLRAGDTIAAVAGEDLGDPLTLDERLRRRAGTTVTLTVSRGEEASRMIEVTPRAVAWQDEDLAVFGGLTSVAALGVALPVEPVVAAVAADGPAARAGIVPGDRIERVWFLDGGEPAAGDKGIRLSDRGIGWPTIAARLREEPEATTLRLLVAGAGGAERTVDLEPAAVPDRFVVDRGLVFEPATRLVQAASLPQALAMGLSRTGNDLTLVYAFLGKLVSRVINPRLVGGPIEIAKQAGKAAQEGFSRLLLFLTMLSANLAVINFLPIPVLDGGHMVFLAYELVRGKPPSEGVVAVLSYIGLALLLTLMLFVFSLDLAWIPRMAEP